MLIDINNNIKIFFLNNILFYFYFYFSYIIYDLINLKKKNYFIFLIGLKAKKEKNKKVNNC